MKLHPITWLLSAAAAVQFVALGVQLTGIVQAANDARPTAYGPYDPGVLHAWLGQSLGGALQRLGAIVVGMVLAVWVELLSRVHQRLRAENARG